MQSLEGEVPFTVVRLPETRLGVQEEPLVQYDFYYLRTGTSRQDALERACEEFREYGFVDGRFDPEWVAGVYHIDGTDVLLDIDWDTAKGLNFWVAEGLLGTFYRDNHVETFPRIRTDRKNTLKLYKGVISDCHKAKESEQDLVDLLRDPEEPCSIMLKPMYLEQTKAWKAANGRCPADLQIMNYGYIWNKRSTFFEDPDSEVWYRLMNKDTLSEEDRRSYRKDFGMEYPRPDVVSAIKSFTFREADKVPDGRDNLFFDGSLQDVFNILKGSGVGFEEGILCSEG